MTTFPSFSQLLESPIQSSMPSALELEALRESVSATAQVLTKADSDAFTQRLARWSEIDCKTPGAIVLPITAEDCQKIISWATKNNVPIACKSGGMSLYSTIDESGVIIDLSNFTGVKHDMASSTATLIGGVTCKTVAVELAKDGFCTALPSANPVGAIPFFLNGGNSPLVSQLGFASDLIVSAEMVTADGRLIEVNEEENADLLYALRGAGQYFGLITRLVVRTSTFQDALSNERGELWSGRFIFSIDRAEEVLDVMKDVVSNEDYATSGLIMIGAPPPTRKPVIAVLPRLIGEAPGITQQQAFERLYDLNSIVSGGSAITIQNNGNALDPLCRPGGFKKLLLTGLYDFEPALFLQVVQLWNDMTTKYPDALGSSFSLQWDSRYPRKPATESANSMHGIRLWTNNMLWYSDASLHIVMQEHLDKAIATMRTNQKEDDYVDFANSVRNGPIDRRYRGDERLRRLKELKAKWDDRGVFSDQLMS